MRSVILVCGLSVLLVTLAVMSLLAAARAEYKGVAVTSGECVEYVRRFLETTHHYTLPPLGRGEAGSAKYLFPRVKRGDINGLDAYGNGTTEPPQPDDVLCFDHPTKAGHVAIITNVTPTEVHIIEQNWSVTGEFVLQLIRRGDRYEVRSDRREAAGYTVQGWCRVAPPITHELRWTALVVDVSGSIRLGNEAQTVKNAIRAFNLCQGPHDHQMIVAFNDADEIIVPDRKGPVPSNYIDGVIKRLWFGRQTNLGSALLQVLRQTREWPHLRIILVTDGIDTEQRADVALPALRKRHALVCPIMIGPHPNVDLLNHLANETGGGIYRGNEVNIGLTIQQMLP